MKTQLIRQSITVTYPAFHGLPKEVKQLVLFSESYFFGELHPLNQRPARRAGAAPSVPAATGIFPALREDGWMATNQHLNPKIHFSPCIITL